MPRKPKKELSRAEAWGWQELMVVSAFRYCLGSSTYVVNACADWLVSIWPLLSQKNREIIQRDLEEAFEQDDRDRAAGDGYKRLGWDCDRTDWERVRKLWQ